MWQTLWKRITREVAMGATFFLPGERRRRLERWLRGREEARKLELADAVIVSFGKSGRTWLRVLLSRFYQLRYRLRPSAFIGFDNLHRKNSGIPKLFFTHDNYLKDYTGNTDSKVDFYGKPVVLMVRDPRDTAVSQFFQWKHRMRGKKKALNRYPEDEAVEIFDFVRGEAGLPKVVGFLNEWARELPRLGPILVVRYEDLRRSSARELERVLRFLGEHATPDELSECLAFASVDNMRALEQKRVFWLAGSRMRAKDASNPDSYKVRRAKVGGWRDYFDDEQIRWIEDYVAAELEPGFGYREDEQTVAPRHEGVAA